MKLIAGTIIKYNPKCNNHGKQILEFDKHMLRNIYIYTGNFTSY